VIAFDVRQLQYQRLDCVLVLEVNFRKRRSFAPSLA